MKKYLLGMFAMVIAIFSIANTFSTRIEKEKKFLTKFKYTGPTSPVNYTSSSNWQISSDESDCGPMGVVNCTVTPQSGTINTTSKLASEIATNGFANITINTKKTP
ncbi:MAG: hypothetical protein KF746_24790 [Chitinophagaceae bacterium]|nr:hypothetical protein [Chitinophagaceae bacterium]